MKVTYKIVFPAGYAVDDISNDNIDINVVRSDSKVFFGTLYTVPNIQKLMTRNYFWAVNMIAVRDLKIDTIMQAVQQIIDDNYLERALDFIGNIETVYGNDQEFERLKLESFFLTMDL